MKKTETLKNAAIMTNKELVSLIQSESSMAEGEAHGAL